MGQNGTLTKDHGAWYLRYYEGKKRKKIWLGRLEDFPTLRLIRPRAEEERARLRLAVDADRLGMTLANYIEHHYLPEVEPRLRPSTYAGYKGLFERYLKERAGIRLWVIRPYHIQQLLNEIAADRKRTLRRTTYSHLKAFLSVIFNHARNYGFYTEANPVTGVFLPARALASRETGVYTLEEIEQILPLLTLEHRAAVAIAGYAGLRLAEIQGLTWDCYADDALTVEETEWRGYRSPPKSKASGSFVPVIPALRDILNEYRRSAPVSGRLFSESLENAGRGPIKAAMKTVGLTWRGWHSFRRGLASNLFELEVSDKVVQRILRHSRVSITRDRYVKVRDPKVEAAMQTLERAVNRPANAGREESSSSA
ncbi:MAG: tyrosine-type recombinase/integrase [Acidobacteria bacterium]|nr:tyrosine-type recombinase/integrase [Acidobacteriota bacterium]